MRDYIIGFLICWSVFGAVILIADTFDMCIKINKVAVLIAMSLPVFIPAAICAFLYGLSWRYISMMKTQFKNK